MLSASNIWTDDSCDCFYKQRECVHSLLTVVLVLCAAGHVLCVCECVCERECVSVSESIHIISVKYVIAIIRQVHRRSTLSSVEKNGLFSIVRETYWFTEKLWTEMISLNAPYERQMISCYEG